jgi:hypothetical protein
MDKFTRFDTFIGDLACGRHDLASDTFALALTNAKPSGVVLADIDEISYQQCSPRAVTSKLERTGGGIRLCFDELTLSASGIVGPFRYFVVYNASSEEKRLVGWSDAGREITLEKDDSIKVKFDRTNGILQIG